MSKLKNTVICCVHIVSIPVSVLSRIFGLGRKLWDALAPSRVRGSGGIFPQKKI